MRKKKMKYLEYTVIFEPQPEGGYTVLVPSLPGCITEGDTLAEAKKNAKEAIKLYCESLVKDGEDLPKDIRKIPIREKIRLAIED